MDSAKVIRLAESAGGKEYGPLSWNMTFKQDALIRFAALIQQSLIDEGWRSPEQVRADLTDAERWRRHEEIMQGAGIEGNLQVRLTMRKDGKVHHNEQFMRKEDFAHLPELSRIMLVALNRHITEQSAIDRARSENET